MFRVRAHVRSDMVSPHRRVFKNGLQLAKMIFEVIRHVNVTLNKTEQSVILDGIQNGLLRDR